MIAAIVGCIALISSVSVQANEAQVSNVRFGSEGKYSGYLVRPEGPGPFPGVVVIHEWWGINDNIRNQAKILADSGFVTLAVDLFGKSTTDPKEAAAMVNAVDQNAATAQLLAAADYLRAQPSVRPDRIGSLGWCFGGGQSLQLALNDPKLVAAVIYYGQPVTDPNQLSKIHAAILGLYGEVDQSIPLDKVKGFDKALTEAKVRHKIHTYPGAGHAFANPSGGDRYKPEAAQDAWKKTIDFLNRFLKR
jgi:carboxymethylenebutenolidase